mmetsp:Transcript_7796/g.20620  ORF Transcript_7796/g.20620 Transcript_7796/m.20620 type:complete len:152 (+) Transcript_7796:24-479(+)
MLDLYARWSKKPQDLSATQFRRTPNQYFIAPQGYATRSAPHAGTFEYGVDADTLLQNLVQVLGSQPRTKVMFCDAARRQLKLSQRTPSGFFVDVVTVQVLELAGGRSTVAMYGRSILGNSDSGVNKARIEEWLLRLHEKVPPNSSAREAHV